MGKKVKTALAKNLIARRKALGFRTAAAFAAHAKIPYGTIRDIEAGYSEGWRETREAIAKALSCTVEDLSGPDAPAKVNLFDEGLTDALAKKVADSIRRDMAIEELAYPGGAEELRELRAEKGQLEKDLDASRRINRSVDKIVFAYWPITTGLAHHLALYFLTGDSEYLQTLDPALQKKMEGAYRSAGLKRPPKPRASNM